jgi:penicillin-binding protein 2
MDPTDGSVLAMGSYPTYDPSVFVGGLSDDQWSSLGTISAFQNFAVQGLYAPASAFKTVPYILAMEESYYPLFQAPEQWDERLPNGDRIPFDPITSHTDDYLCNGAHRFVLNDQSVQTKNDWRPQGHSLLDLHGALVESCDLYFWDIARSLWEEREDDSGIDKENLLQEYARAFGFGTATGIDLPFERDGLIPDRDWFRAEQRENTGRVRPDGPWLGGDLMDIAVGQGAVLTTPLQMASGYSAMVNGGTLWQPRVVSEIVNSNGEIIERNPASVIREIDMSPETVQWLRSDLRDVVNDVGGPKVRDGYDYFGGTAADAFEEWRMDEDYGHNVALVGGKTGTGEVIKDIRGDKAFREVDNAWFMGVAPINNPKYVVSIVVERGGSGGGVAAPIAVQILQYLLNGPDGVSENLAPGLDSD